MNKKSLGASKLKKWMSGRKGSAALLASAAGVHVQVVYKWASGATRPSDESKLAIEHCTKGVVCISDWFPKRKQKPSLSPKPSVSGAVI